MKKGSIINAENAAKLIALIKGLILGLYCNNSMIGTGNSAKSHGFYAGIVGRTL